MRQLKEPVYFPRMLVNDRYPSLCIRVAMKCLGDYAVEILVVTFMLLLEDCKAELAFAEVCRRWLERDAAV